MKFTSFDVNGDAYLLEYENLVILVDGGYYGNVIQKLKGINKIDLIICTHYDGDHINGILKILKCNRFTIKEIWLPEIIGSIGYSINPKIFNELISLLGVEEYYTNSFNESKFISHQFGSENQINYKSTIEFLRKYFNLLSHHIKKQIVSQANIIMQLFGILSHSNILVRWFEFKNYETNYACTFNMIALNAEEKRYTYLHPSSLISLLYLTTINSNSLVFKFDNVCYPNILYTADSELTFCSNPIQLKDFSLVTAPHHGSHSNDKAYQNISGKDLTFVRSHFHSIRKVSTHLTSNVVYCTNCLISTGHQDIMFDLINNQFRTQAMTCPINNSRNCYIKNKIRQNCTQ